MAGAGVQTGTVHMIAIDERPRVVPVDDDLTWFVEEPY